VEFWAQERRLAENATHTKNRSKFNCDQTQSGEGLLRPAFFGLKQSTMTCSFALLRTSAPASVGLAQCKKRRLAQPPFL